MSVWSFFGDIFVGTFSDDLGAISAAILADKWIHSWTFFERLLEAVWSHLGRFLGCLGLS